MTSTLRHRQWRLAAAATQPRCAGGRSPEWVLTVLVSRTPETGMRASRSEQAERARDGRLLFPGRDLEAQQSTTSMELHTRTRRQEPLGSARTWRDPSLKAAREAAGGAGDGGAEAKLERTALRRTSAGRLAAAVRLAVVDDTVRSVSVTPRGVLGIAMLAVLNLVVVMLTRRRK